MSYTTNVYFKHIKVAIFSSDRSYHELMSNKLRFYSKLQGNVFQFLSDLSLTDVLNVKIVSLSHQSCF